MKEYCKKVDPEKGGVWRLSFFAHGFVNTTTNQSRILFTIPNIKTSAIILNNQSFNILLSYAS